LPSQLGFPISERTVRFRRPIRKLSSCFQEDPPMRNLIHCALYLCFFLYGLPTAQSAPQTGAWQQEELNEKFMRSLSKRDCMSKTIASLQSGCRTDSCLKTLAGISGDCTSWATGDRAEFCRSYDRDYIGPYCATNELDARRCVLLHIGKVTVCPSGADQTPRVQTPNNEVPKQ
jgi:hypothetical protein